MARIQFDQIAHSYYPEPKAWSDYALKEINTVWEDGGAYALLGPSGCGKTTLLNVISGLLKPSKGRVLYNDVDVTVLPPEKRNIAQVFQFPVLYDTMSVFDNLAFPLKNRGLSKADTARRVQEVAEILDLTPDLKKKAAGLSADAKQKISLGRGLVRSDVAAVLFDEPLTVIDPHLKWSLRRKLKEIGLVVKAAALMGTLTRRWCDEDLDAIGFIYIDGHGRKHKLSKTHVARRRLCMPATTDFWVNVTLT